MAIYSPFYLSPPHGKCDGEVWESPPKVDYEMFYAQRLKELAVAQFSIEGLPTDMFTPTIVSMLQYGYGNVCFFVDDVYNGLLALPCNVMAWGINGKPSVVKVFSPTSGIGYERTLDARTDDFFVCYDRQCMVAINGGTWMSTAQYFKPWLRQLIEISVTIDINTFAQRLPVITLSDLEDRLTMENIMEKVMKGFLFIELKERKNKGDKKPLSESIKSLKTDAPYLIDKLEAERKLLWNQIIETMGYKVNANSSKKERQIVDEVQGNLEETLGFYESRRQPRMEGVEWLRNHGYENARLKEVTNVKEAQIEEVQQNDGGRQESE